jgi:hypothetical protein
MQKNETILSDRAQKAANKVKEYFARRPVGGQIYDYQLWEDFKQRCKDYNIMMTPNGMEHMIKLANKIDEVLFPIARASGIGPIQFTEERIDKLLEAIKNNKDWMKETDQLHDAIISETDKNLILQTKKK